MNANYLVERGAGGESLVLRVYSNKLDAARVERDVLKLLEGRNVFAPKAYGLVEAAGRPVLALECLRGGTFQSFLQRGEKVPPATYRMIGELAARVHSITFPEMGFFEPGLKIHKPFDTFSELIRWFVQKTLKELLESNSPRLDRAVNLRLQKLVDEQWHLVQATEPAFQLTHCDFNPKNILVEEHGVPTGLIDWEFAQSGNGLIDLGNFFRFSYDYDEWAAREFELGYRNVLPLPHNWLDVAKLLDLGNMASFLERKEDYQKSFRTARIVIGETLRHFGY